MSGNAKKLFDWTGLIFLIERDSGLQWLIESHALSRMTKVRTMSGSRLVDTESHL